MKQKPASRGERNVLHALVRWLQLGEREVVAWRDSFFGSDPSRALADRTNNVLIVCRRAALQWP